MTKATTARPRWDGIKALRRMLVPIDSLAPHPLNPRQHDLPAIKESLERYGQQRPILIVPAGRIHADQATIIAGHGTTAAAAGLGWNRIAALESELTDDEIDRYVLADNRTSDRAGYEDETLAKLLTQVNERGGLAGTGYEREDLRSLLADLRARERRARADADDSPEVPATPHSKRGELYDLGEHLLMCGDCTSDEDLATLIGGAKPGAIFTDPPYGIHLDTKFSEMHGPNAYGPGGNDYAPVIGDDVPFDPTPIFDRFAKVKEQFWWGADYYREHLPAGGSWLVWDKRDNESGMALDDLLGSAFELCWSRQAHKREIMRVLWAGHHGMQGEDTKRRTHPTQKPVALTAWVLERHVKRGPVLDLYAGSGSTLIGAELAGVQCLAMEIDPAYCDVVRQRYADVTGKPEFAPEA